MKQQILSLLLVVFSLLGILDAGFITYEEFSGQVPNCIPPFQCGTVLNSEYSHLAGVPISVFGLTFYIAMFTLSVFNLTEVSLKIPIIKTVRNTLFVFSCGGFLFSLYLISLMQFVIGAWCLWCLFSAITSISLFILATALKRVGKPIASE